MFFGKSNAQILKEAQKLSGKGKLTDRHISALANPKTVIDSMSQRNYIDEATDLAKEKRKHKSCPPNKRKKQIIPRKRSASDPGVTDYSLETPFGKVFVKLDDDKYSPLGIKDQRVIYDSTGRNWSYKDIADILDGLIKTYIQIKNQQNAIHLVEEIYNYVSQPRIETPFPFYAIRCTKSTLGLTRDNANAAASLCGILLLSEARKNKALGVWEIGALKTILDNVKAGKSNPFAPIIGEDGDYIQSGHGKTEKAVKMLEEMEPPVSKTPIILSTFQLMTPIGINIPVQLLEVEGSKFLEHNLMKEYTVICEQLNSMLLELYDYEKREEHIWNLLEILYQYSKNSVDITPKDFRTKRDLPLFISTQIKKFNSEIKIISGFPNFIFETQTRTISFAKICVILLFDKSNYVKIPAQFIWNFVNLKHCVAKKNLSLLGIDPSTINGMTPRYKINFDKTERLHIEPAKQSLRDTKGTLCKFCHKLIAPNDKHSLALLLDVCDKCFSKEPTKLPKINFSVSNNIFTIEERRFNLDNNLGNDFNCFWRLLEPYNIKEETQQLILKYIRSKYAPNFETTGLMDDTHIKYFVEAYNNTVTNGSSLYIHLDYYDQFLNNIPYPSQSWGNPNATIKINICLILTDGGAIGHYIGSV